MEKELKTLKDMPLIANPTWTLIDKEKLKAEAVKWVKDLRKYGYLSLNEALVCDTQYLVPERKKEQVIAGKKATEMWIKHFFNLTEADIQ